MVRMGRRKKKRKCEDLSLVVGPFLACDVRSPVFAHTWLTARQCQLSTLYFLGFECVILLAVVLVSSTALRSDKRGSDGG